MYPLNDIFVYSRSMSVGKRIRELRKAAGMTLEQLGQLFATKEKSEGFGKQAVSAWERDVNQLTADQIIKICTRFKVSTDYLLHGKDFLLPDENELIENYKNSSPDMKKAIIGMSRYSKANFIEIPNSASVSDIGDHKR